MSTLTLTYTSEEEAQKVLQVLASEGLLPEAYMMMPNGRIAAVSRPNHRTVLSTIEPLSEQDLPDADALRRLVERKFESFG
jgi:hypothetical protein